MRHVKWRIHWQLVVSVAHWLPCIWPAETSNVNTASVQKKYRSKRGKKRQNAWRACTPQTEMEGWTEYEQNSTSIKRLMERFHSRESQDQCPPLAHVGQALNMRFTTYLPASALCDRKNIGQINTHTHTQVTVTPSISSAGFPHHYGKPLFFPTALHAVFRGGQITSLGSNDKRILDLFS